MRGVVVEDSMNDFAGRNLGLVGIEEADELLMPMALHVTANHCVVEDIERSEQRGRSVPLVIMGHGPSAVCCRAVAGGPQPSVTPFHATGSETAVSFD